MLVNPLSEIKPESLKGWKFAAQVIANNDPEKLRRLRVRVPTIMDSIPDADLPWAFPDLDSGTGCKSGIGSFSVPDVGAFIYVEFQDGDIHFPFYTGGAYTKNTHITELEVNYPNRRGSKDSAGNLMYIDKQSGTAYFHHQSGLILQVTVDGHVTITVPDKITASTGSNVGITINGNASIAVTGTTTIQSGGDCSITAPLIKLN
jgi:hypothetical protein